MDFSGNETRLVFGDCSEMPSDGALRRCLEYLNANFQYLLKELEGLKTEGDQKIAAMAPFLARSLLEVAFTGLVGRIDPFRVLSIHRIQKGTGYDRTKPWKAAMRWQGDVMADAPAQHMVWTEKMEPQSMPRALLGFYYDELLWQPALQRLYDDALEGYEGIWLSELKARPLTSFCGSKRGSLGGLYSELSKVVHYESVVEVAAPDHLTVRELVNRALRDIAELSLVVAFMEHPVGRLSTSEALSGFAWFESLEILR